jgi:hypothetical protein
MIFDIPILTGDTFEALYEIDPLIHFKYGEGGYKWSGIIRFSILVSKAGKEAALQSKEVKDLMNALEGMKKRPTALEQVLEASE